MKTYVIEGTVYWAGGFHLEIAARDEDHARIVAESIIRENEHIAGTPELQEVCVEVIQEGNNE
jgi:hypothetical protein